MAKTKIKDLRQLHDEELQLELERIRRRLFDLRSQAVTEKLEDPSMLTKAKRELAQILTLQGERQRVKAAAAAVAEKQKAEEEAKKRQAGQAAPAAAKA